MAHRSGLGVLVIDCPGDLEQAAAFWGAALGGPVDVDANGKYAEIGAQGDMKVLVQTVDHPARVHLDIEADDKHAEQARLHALGALTVAPVKGWIVMEAPTGHRFCIVNPQSEAFGSHAKVWS